MKRPKGNNLEGLQFVVKNEGGSTDHLLRKGQIVKLILDDKTNRPLFRPVGGGFSNFIRFEDLTLVK